MSKVYAFFEKYIDTLAGINIRPMDIVEIIIIAFIIYQVLSWIKNTKAWMLMKGILVVIAFIAIAKLLNMQIILVIAKMSASVLAIAAVIVFQPELRRALEKLGEKDIIKRILPFNGADNDNERFSDYVLSEIVDAVFAMSKVKTGALIVVEKNIELTEYVRTGIRIGAFVSKELLINIFEHNTPLHDGAVIIREDKIISATCYLPLSENLNINKKLGTRHRAALGMSEVSDALIIVSSEETGKVSAAVDGKIYLDLNEKKLKDHLKAIQKSGGFRVGLGREQNEKEDIKKPSV